MRWLRFGSSVGVVLVAHLQLGCGGSGADIYDTCTGTEQCPGGTTCQVANTTTDGFQGTYCTFTCNVDSDCPSDGFAAPVCEAGQCYAGCPSGSGCPYAETCGTDGSLFFCVP